MVSTVLNFIKFVFNLIFRSVYQTHTHARATRAHTGIYLADHMADCLRGYGIHDKVCSVTSICCN
jgi:lipoate-protein ligase B